MLPITLFVLALIVGAFCSGIIWTMEENPFRAKIFFFLFPIALGIFSVISLLRNDLLFGNFFLGVLGSLIILVPFRALPYIEGWTRTGSFLERFLGFALHHSLLGLAMVVVVIFVSVISVLSDRQVMNAEIASFGLGWGVFWLASQIPEIIRNGTFFF